MKVRMVIEVGAYERLVIAKYFAPVSGGIDRVRTRATRAQVRRFGQAALKTAVREQEAALRGKARAAAGRLKSPPGIGLQSPFLREPDEKQQALRW